VSVEVRARGSGGFVSDPGGWSVSIYPWPGVRSEVYPDNGSPVGGVGVEGTFELSPPAGWHEVAADATGRATVTFTPEHSGQAILSVFALRPDGTQSDYDTWYTFYVAG
jgi:hypothetical protein